MDPMLACAFGLPLFLVFLLRWYITSSTTCRSKNRLEGKTVVITGSTSGIGKAAATECAYRGGKVILACRDKVKGEATATSIRKKTGNEDVHFRPLDLNNLKSVREFVESFCAQNNYLDVLINNAAYLGPRKRTMDGFDWTFQVNFLGHFLLTNLLLKKLKPEVAPGQMRIINLTSDSYKLEKLNLDDLMYEKTKYDIYKSYSKSKLAMLLFTMELSYRFAGTGVVSMAVHPGAAKTGLLRHYPGICGDLLRLVSKMCFRSPTAAAQTVVFCAVVDEISEFSGRYMCDCLAREIQPIGKDYRTAEKLWEICNHLTGLEILKVNAPA